MRNIFFFTCTLLSILTLYSKMTLNFQIAKKPKHAHLSEWISSIRNHFWYCCQHCDGDELRLKLLWIRVLHHVCDDHDYCDHDELPESELSKTFLESDSSTMRELREVVTEPRWLKSLAHYTRNCHTGMVEASKFLFCQMEARQISIYKQLALLIQKFTCLSSKSHNIN